MAPPQTATGGHGMTMGRRLGLPETPLTGRVPEHDTVVYSFTGRADGTMSVRHGAGDAIANRAAAVRTLNLGPAQTAFMTQVHGATVVVAGAEDSSTGQPPEADAIMSAVPGQGVAVMVADCVPVLLAAGTAVSAVHAGRAGVLADIISRAAHQTSSLGGVATSELTAIIGPAIGPCCYEVPVEMATVVDAEVPGVLGSTSWGTPSLDLPAGVLSQLRQCGVNRVFSTGSCTLGHADRWFSHRATHPAHGGWADGRQIGVIVREAA